MPYIKSICKAGRTKEIGRYYTRRCQPGGERRAPKKKKTTKQQQKVNDRQLERKLTRILNANFNETSWYLTYSYREEERPTDIKTLKSHRKKLLEKIREVYKAENRTLKYVETAEVGKRGGTHIHIVVNDIDVRKIKSKKVWKYGYVTAKPLDDSGQYRKLANYFIKYFQKTRGTDACIQKKAYNCSRNLIRPEPRKKAMLGSRFSKEIKVPSGWELDKGSVEVGITEDGYEFLFYTIVQLHRRI